MGDALVAVLLIVTGIAVAGWCLVVYLLNELRVAHTRLGGMTENLQAIWARLSEPALPPAEELLDPALLEILEQTVQSVEGGKVVPFKPKEER